MPPRIAINGVGRIGRAVIRRLTADDRVELVAANDLAGPEQIAALLARDSFQGPFPGSVEAGDGELTIDGRSVPLYREADIGRVPWREHGVDFVIEATGSHVGGRTAEAHLGGGVRRAIVSSNASQADITVCYGVNHTDIEDAHELISAASCTTNCLAVVASVLDRDLGIERALLNTVHCFNNNQSLTDAPHADPRRARAASVNMVPTSTGASSAIGLVLPELADRLDGFAVRVPAAQVSLIDLVAQVATDVTPKRVNEIFREAAEGEMLGVLSTSEAALVSSDFVGDPHSAIVDLPLTQVAGGRLVRTVAWYDNEMGYASRLLDLAAWLGEH